MITRAEIEWRNQALIAYATLLFLSRLFLPKRHEFIHNTECTRALVEGLLNVVKHVVCLSNLNVTKCIIDVGLILDFGRGRKLILTDRGANRINIDRQEVHGGPVLGLGNRLSHLLYALLGSFILSLH